MSKPTNPRRRRWWRLFTQFSLRTLLILTTLAALGCWWFLRPESRDEELAGRYLKLRREVRVRTPLPEQAAAAGEEHELLISTGAWCVREEHGDLLIDGRYADDQPHGKWTIYHVNGQKAAEGAVFCGARTGLWRTWDEEGTLRSEATYKAVLRTERKPPAMRPFVNTVIPVVGTIPLTPVQFGGRMMGGAPPLYFPPVWETTHVAVRHGPAKAWFASGQLHLEGTYQEDLREGPWTFYDEQGRITEQGSYRAGLREGAWNLLDPVSGQIVARDFLADLPKDQLETLLAKLGDDLAAGSISRKIAAAQRLEEIGPPALPCLIRALESADPETQLLALRALCRLQPLPAEALAQIAPLADHSDERVALRARLAVYLAKPSEQSQLFAPLLASLESAGDELAIEACLAMYRADPDRQLAVLLPLVERMSHGAEAYQFGSSPSGGYVAQVADLGWDVVPQLDSIYPQASSAARWFAVLVLQDLVARGKPTIVETSAGVREAQWEIPEQAQPLLQRAKADADPRVQEAAKRVGRQAIWGGNGAGIWGQSGGLF